MDGERIWAHGYVRTVIPSVVPVEPRDGIDQTSQPPYLFAQEEVRPREELDVRTTNKYGRGSYERHRGVREGV